jgi:hypothetical protein
LGLEGEAAAFTRTDKKNLDRLVQDMWIGRDTNNPSVTTRLKILEEDRDKVITVHVALFGDEDHEGFIVKFERALGVFRGGIWALTIFGIVFMAIFGYALTLIVPAAKLVIDDYYAHHPTAKQSMILPYTNAQDAGAPPQNQRYENRR